MWFLQTDTLLLITGFCCLAAILRALEHTWSRPLSLSWLFPIVEAAILFVIDRGLLLFYLGYIVLGYGLARILGALKRGRPAFMLFACLLAAAPLLLSRAEPLGLSLPVALVGVAFSVFKLIDVLYYVYYGNQRVAFTPLLSYLLFLPVLTAGPIFRYRDFLGQLQAPKPMDAPAAEYCVKRIIRGLFKKLVMVELLLILFDRLRELAPVLPVSLGITVLSYVLLYLDLSGYSDIAIAFSRVAGMDAPENFNRPWRAPTFTKFWRSWHSSVSDFIREHVYVVVAKRKLNKWHGGVIAFFTMLIMALWHDFSIAYLIGGIYLGTLLMLENFLGLTTVNPRKVRRLYYVFRCVLTNFLFALNTLIFMLPAGDILPVVRGLFRL